MIQSTIRIDKQNIGIYKEKLNMATQHNSTTLVRLTAALLAISTLFFALAVIVERNSEASEAPHSEESQEGTTSEGTPSTETTHTETTSESNTAESSSHNNETVLGINLENPWIVWGFVGISLLMSVAVLRFGKTALLLTIPLAGVAAILDAREALFQFAGNNTSVAALAVIVALAHVAAAVFAFMAWRSLKVAASAASIRK